MDLEDIKECYFNPDKFGLQYDDDDLLMKKIEYIRNLVKIIRMLNKINNVNTEDELLLQQLEEEAKKRKSELEDKMKKGTITPKEEEERRRLLEQEIKHSEKDLEKAMLELEARLANSNQEGNELRKQLEEAQKEISEDHGTRLAKLESGTKSTSGDLNENEKELIAQLFDSYGHPTIAKGIRDGTIKPTSELLDKYTKGEIEQKNKLIEYFEKQLSELQRDKEKISEELKSAKLSNEDEIRKLEGKMVEVNTLQEKEQLQAQIDQLKKQKQKEKEKEDISSECQILLDEYNKTYNNIKNQLNNLLSILKTLSGKKLKAKKKEAIKAIQNEKKKYDKSVKDVLECLKKQKGGTTNSKREKNNYNSKMVLLNGGSIEDIQSQTNEIENLISQITNLDEKVEEEDTLRNEIYDQDIQNHTSRMRSSNSNKSGMDCSDWLSTIDDIIEKANTIQGIIETEVIEQSSIRRRLKSDFKNVF